MEEEGREGRQGIERQKEGSESDKRVRDNKEWNLVSRGVKIRS